MTVALKKWGNSIALRIPKDIANTLQVDDNSFVELDVLDGILTLRPKKEDRLEILISQINSKNLHKEIDFGESVGNESW